MMVVDNVKVAVRVRPLLPKEALAGEQQCVQVHKDTNQILLGKDRAFAFDFVITQSEKQEDVYNICIEKLVASCFEGYNATVFAYGQTGSGKTFTIGGTNAVTLTEDEVGIIPRALQRIFSSVEIGRQQGVEYAVLVSYLELYKEDLRDLLDSSTNAKDITIREDDQGNTVVSGMREVPCQTIDEVLYCLQHGSAARQTGSTQMNEHSSRSHSVFTVTIEQQWRAEEETADVYPEQYHYICSKFHFVDLAGSERAHRTGNVGDRFKESITINTGLLALGNVISALGDPKKKSSHIPYRDSKITRLLKDSLGGNSKTLMICCVSPATCDFDETLNALKYANRARDIQNKPVVNRDVQSIRLEEMQNEIQALRRELEKKDSMLREETILTSRSTNVDFPPVDNGVKDTQIDRLQRTCDNLQQMMHEAAEVMNSLQGSVDTTKNASLEKAVVKWLYRYNQMKEMYGTMAENSSKSADELAVELTKLRSMLKNDEEIFNKKNKDLSNLKKENQQLMSDNQLLTAELDGLRQRCSGLEEQLVERQRHVDAFTISSINEPIPPLDTRRIMSVPPRHTIENPTERPVHTSPAVFTLERYMQGFRARSQLLGDRLDDEDVVLHQPFPDGDRTDVNTNTSNSQLLELEQNRNHYDPYNRLSRNGEPKQDPNTDGNGDLLDIHSSMDKHQKEIRQAKLKSQEFNSRLRDLTIAIRMKEQLIRQLVKNEKDSSILMKQHQEKISHMEEEKIRTNKELQDLQKEFQKLDSREKVETSNKKKLQGEYKRKIDSAKRRLTNIQNKQKETAKLAGMSERADLKINDLHLAVAKMKQQQDELQKKLRLEQEKKEKLEKEMTKEQHRVRELEDMTLQQQKVLKIKTEEAAAATRRLRKGSIGSMSFGREMEDAKLLEQRQWLDMEMNKILEQRKQMEMLEKELKSRALIIARKEEMIKEKGALELKNLRASQQLEMGAQKDIQDLSNEKKNIEKEKSALDEKLHTSGALSNHEERRFLELSEAIEALDAAIEFKNEIIASHQEEIRRSQILVEHEDNLTNRLKSLNVIEAQKLLSRYFNKVIELRESAQVSDRQLQDMQIQMDEQGKVLAEMEASLESQRIDLDNRLTEQQQIYESQISSLLQKISEKDSSEPNTQQFIKIQQLEKDLYYYKKTSRDLKKKLREVLLRLGEHPSSAVSAEVYIGESSEPLDFEPHVRHTSPTRGSPTHLPPLVSTSASALTSLTSIDGPHVKISKKELRPMSHEEVILRRSHLQSAQSTRNSTDSLDGN